MMDKSTSCNSAIGSSEKGLRASTSTIAPGAISQQFATVPGQSYDVSFRGSARARAQRPPTLISVAAAVPLAARTSTRT